MPQQPKGNRSPIRYPTLETDKVPINSDLGWDSSNPNLHKPQMDFTKARIQSPHNVKIVIQNTQSESMTADHIPRRSYSHNTTETQSRKRGAHSQSLPADNRFQGYQQNKRHHAAEKNVENFVAGMARNIKKIIVNAHHKDPENPHNHTKPTRRQAIRQHDAKGVSNFHLDQDDPIVRTYAGHPRCNYCFIVSHPRVGCKFRKEDLRNRLDRAVHPDKGLLSYKDVRYPSRINKAPATTLEDLPNEMLEKICEHLTFKDRCKLGATNKRIRFVLTADKFWLKVSMPNHILKYEIINKLINMGTQSLNIPWSSIDGEWQEYTHLVENLSAYSSNLRQLNIQSISH